MSMALLWAALAGGELLLILFLALLASWLRNRRLRRRDRKAIALLVADAKNRKDQRLTEIAEFLSSKYALEGDRNDDATRALYQVERGLIQDFANIYLKRDAQAAANFCTPVVEGFSEYWAATPAASRADAGGETAEEGGEMDYLRTENQRLSSELRVAMDTLSRMLNEYSEVFSKDADLGDIQVVDGEPVPEDTREDAAVADDESGAEAELVVEGAEQPAVSGEAVSAADAAPSPAASDLSVEELPDAVEAAEAQATDLSLDEEELPAESVQQDSDEAGVKRESSG
jgi:hypothetical protein